MATFVASLISGGVQEISLISLISGYCTNIFEQNSQIIAKIEISTEAMLIRALIKGTRSFVARALKKCAHAGTSPSRTWFVNNYFNVWDIITTYVKARIK
jgi:hypothetical protein